jgi:hypothetical protein
MHAYSVNTMELERPLGENLRAKAFQAAYEVTMQV